MKRKLVYSLFLCVMCLFFSHEGKGQNSWFASVDGRSIDKGTIDSPWSIGYAIGGSSPVQPGDTLFIREGVYVSDNGFWIWLNGVEANPIIIKPYSNEKVILKGNVFTGGAATLRLNGSHIHVYDLIVTQTERDRISNIQSSGPSDISTEIGVVITGPYSKLINCFIYNVNSSLINSPSTAINAEIYGNIGFYAGWMEISNNDARYFGHGHGLYFQNANGRKVIEDNILFKSYGNGIQFYSEGGTGTEGSDVKSNVIFSSGALAAEFGNNGGYNYLFDSNDGTVLDGNFSYHLDLGANYSIGYSSTGEYIKAINNYCLGGNNGFFYMRFKNIYARNNTAVMKNRRSDGYDYSLAQVYYPEDEETYQLDIDNSIYYTDNAEFAYAGLFSTWQSKYNIDANGSCTYVSALTEVPNKVEVLPNKYETKRAHVVIHNHQLLPTVPVDVSNVLSIGDAYWLYDVEDIRKPIQQGTYSGSNLKIPTNQTSVFPIAGTEVFTQPVHSGNDFGVFLLIGRPIDISESTCNLTINSLEPAVVYEEVVVDFTLSGECAGPVTAILYDEAQNQIALLENVNNGFSMNLPELCEGCKEGSYTIQLECSGAQVSETFTYKPLQITSCTPDPTTGSYTINYYSPIEGVVALKVTGISGEVAIVSTTVNAIPGKNATVVDISGATAGEYITQLQLGTRITADTITKIDPPKELEIISCQPDQTFTDFIVTYISPRTVEVTLQVFDASNVELRTDKLSSILGEQTESVVDLSGYIAGNYRTVLDDGYTTQECIVTKFRPLEIISCTPNETLSEVQVYFYSSVTENIKVEVIDSSGQVVFADQVGAIVGENNQVTVNLTNQAPGVYSIGLTALSNGQSDVCEAIRQEDPRVLEITGCSPDSTAGPYTVTFYSPVIENITVEIINDGSGDVVLTQSVPVTMGENNQIQLDLADQSPGTYTTQLKIPSNDQTASCQVTREADPRALEIISCLPASTIGAYVVTFYSPVSENITLEVINDDSGVVVLTKSVSATIGENNQIPLDLADQSSGTYTTKLMIPSNDQTTSCQVIREEDPRALEIISCLPASTIGAYVVAFYSSVTENITLEVINDATGAVVLTKTVPATIGENNQIPLDLADQSPGTYTTKLTIPSNDQTTSCQVIREADSRSLEIISCSPGSTEGPFIITFYSPVSEQVSVEVVDKTELVVFTEFVAATIGTNNQISLDINSQPPGVYTTRLFIASNNQTDKCEVIRLEDPKPLSIISYSPNPTYGVVSLLFYSPQNKMITVSVFNSSGAQLSSETHAAVSGDNNRVDIKLGSFDAGTYTIKVDDGTTSDECSVIKQDEVSPRSLEILNYTKETTSSVTIDYYCPSSATLQVDVFDSSGNRMMQMSKAAALGNNTLIFDISILDSGQYSIHLFDGVTSKSCTVIREEDLKPFSLISSKPEITSDLYEVKFHLPIRQSVSVEVIDRAGKVVYKEVIVGKTGSNKVVLNLSNLNNGEYDVIFSDGNDRLKRVVTVEGVVMK